MIRNLMDTDKAGVFAVLVLVIGVALAASPLANTFTYAFVPMVTTLVMMLVVTGEGYTREGWQSLGLHRAGLRLWPFTLLVPAVINGVGFVLVLITGLARFGFTADAAAALGEIPVPVGIVVGLAVTTVTTSLGEELGWRGYLLPRMRQLGEGKALVLSGLLWGVWHLPLMLLTDTYHGDLNPWTYFPLFILTVLSVNFAIGYTRLRTESVWPAAIMHAAANLAWNAYHFYYTASSPWTDYVTGDTGVVQLLCYGLVAIWVARGIARRRHIKKEVA